MINYIRADHPILQILQKGAWRKFYWRAFCFLRREDVKGIMGIQKSLVKKRNYHYEVLVVNDQRSTTSRVGIGIRSVHLETRP